MGDSFTHLHLHTEFSMLDGAARVGDVVAAAVADGQPAIGITDHGNMYGVLDFYRACNEQGITPILGFEAYMAKESRTERPAMRGRVDDMGGDVEGGEKAFYHLTLLAENNVGYKNLLKLASLAYLEGYYRKPKLDWELLERHHEGVIATTGCLGGQVLQALLRGDDEGALKIAGRLQDIFGQDNLFIELQDHGLAAQIQTNPKAGRDRQAPAGPAARHERQPLHPPRGPPRPRRVAVRADRGRRSTIPNRFKFEGDQHYLKTAAEMRHLFREVPTSCDNTLWIAERANVEIEFGKPQLPAFPLPDGFDDRHRLPASTRLRGRQAAVRLIDGS